MLNKFCGFNEISDELANTIPPLIGVQTFHMLTGVANRDPDPQERQKYPVIYPMQQIPSKDMVWDAGKGRHVPIALGQAIFNDKGEAIPQMTLLMPGIGLAFWRYSGKFSLKAGVYEDEQKWAYLQLSNYNGKKVGRDGTKEALYELIDVKANSIKELDEIETLTTALAYVKTMEISEAREISDSLNWGYQSDADIVMANVKKYAKDNPTEFLAKVKDPMTEIKATIKMAMDKGIIGYDTNNGRIFMGNQTIVSFNAHPQGFDYLTAFANWSTEAKNGTNVIDGIRNKLNKKTKTTAIAE